jgi:hypothetical protein
LIVSLKREVEAAKKSKKHEAEKKRRMMVTVIWMTASKEWNAQVHRILEVTSDHFLMTARRMMARKMKRTN